MHSPTPSHLRFVAPPTGLPDPAATHAWSLGCALALAASLVWSLTVERVDEPPPVSSVSWIEGSGGPGVR